MNTACVRSGPDVSPLGERWAATSMACLQAPSQEEAAYLFGVGRSSVQYARIVLRDAEPETVVAVDVGIMIVKAAAALARLLR
jgi:hypothetical protein